MAILIVKIAAHLAAIPATPYSSYRVYAGGMSISVMLVYSSCIMRYKVSSVIQYYPRIVDDNQKMTHPIPVHNQYASWTCVAAVIVNFHVEYWYIINETLE